MLPTDALNRFDPPKGFAPVQLKSELRLSRFGYRAAGLALLVPVGIPSEIVPMMAIAEIPHGPEWLRGMINLHGNLVPVCELASILGGASAKSVARPMILVLGKGEKAAGFVTEGLPVTVREAKPSSAVSGLPDMLARHVTDTLATEDEVWLEVDYEGLLREAV